MNTYTGVRDSSLPCLQVPRGWYFNVSSRTLELFMCTTSAIVGGVYPLMLLTNSYITGNSYDEHIHCRSRQCFLLHLRVPVGLRFHCSLDNVGSWVARLMMLVLSLPVQLAHYVSLLLLIISLSNVVL